MPAHARIHALLVESSRRKAWIPWTRAFGAARARRRELRSIRSHGTQFNIFYVCNKRKLIHHMYMARRLHLAMDTRKLRNNRRDRALLSKRTEYSMSEIREHMKVIGKDGVPVGTVDRVEATRIKL